MTLIRKSFRAVALILAVLSLAACDGSGPAQQQQAGSSDSAEPLAISEPRAPETDASEQQVPDGEDDSPGAMLFAANCAVCHGSRGGGGLGPALTGNQNLQNGDYVIGKVLLGGGGMPPFAGRLTSDEIATVTTYARTSWDNAFGEVKAETVEVQWSGLRAGPTLVGGVEAAAAPQPDEDTDEDSDEGDESEEENGEEDGDSEEESSEDEDNGETSASGSDVYVQAGCDSCHGSDGEGGTGPALAGNDSLGDPEAVITQIVQGGGGMPSFGDELSAEEIAAVATHERTSWGNDFGEVTADDVKDIQDDNGDENGDEDNGEENDTQADEERTGSLTLSATPDDVRVTVVGPDRYLHFTVLSGTEELTDLQPGEYTVTATRAGHSLSTNYLTVEAGQNVDADIKLESTGGAGEPQ